MNRGGPVYLLFGCIVCASWELRLFVILGEIPKLRVDQFTGRGSGITKVGQGG